MIKTITQTDLLLYAYNESGLSESDRVQRGIDGDPLVQRDFKELVQAIYSMDDLLLEPSEKSIRRILDFSKGN